MDFSHAHTDDPLGLATASGIILKNLETGEAQEYVEAKSTAGYWIVAAAQAIKPRSVHRMTYEVLSGSTLTIPLGAIVNTSYFITEFSVTQNSGANVIANVTAVEPSDPAKFAAYETESYDITGGFGIKNKFGATAADCFITCNMTVNMEMTEAMHETSGDYCDGGISMHGFKENYSMEAYGAITIATGGKYTAKPVKSGNAEHTIYSVEYFKYPNGV